jgi:RNA polymerase sigma-70 factor (ECF subfamily)
MEWGHMERFALARAVTSVTPATAELGLPCSVVETEECGSEADLIARLRAGQIAALAEAYDAHHVHVRACAQRIVGDDDGAEDLVQETFLTLPQAMGRFRSESSLRTFLVSIAVNHARHYVRAAIRRRAALARLAREPEEAARGPEREATRAELAEVLVVALDALPLEQRIAVVLIDVEERSSAEVARIVGVPESTVRTRVFHGRRKLRETLAGRGLR